MGDMNITGPIAITKYGDTNYGQTAAPNPYARGKNANLKAPPSGDAERDRLNQLAYNNPLNQNWIFYDLGVRGKGANKTISQQASLPDSSTGLPPNATVYTTTVKIDPIPPNLGIAKK